MSNYSTPSGSWYGEREIFADPFLLIGLIAVVRRILLVTAETGQVTSAEEFQNLLIELGVLTALVIALAAAPSPSL